ncbi:MAG TPA: HAD family phosphatase [Thermoleophilaceae bacterium]
MIRAVISDFGGVLTTPLAEGMLAYQEEAGVSLEGLGKAMARSTDEHGEHPLFELERGRITEGEFQERIQPYLEDEFDLAHLRRLFFERIKPNRAMIDYLRALRDRGLRLALLTNNVREWEPLWRGNLPEIDEIFEVVVDSAFVGMRKPEPEIYELTLERLGGVQANECAFLDDLDVNCDAARALGMAAIRFESTDQAIAALDALLS